MTDKVTLGNITSFQNDSTAAAQYNSNNTAIIAAMDNTLSLNGQAPNQMQATLDMNNNQIINLPSPNNQSSPLRLQDVTLLNGSGTITAVPTGGTTGQVLTKTSNANYVMNWQTVPTTPFGSANSWTALQTFNNSDIAMVGSSTGTTTISSANAGASNFTLTLPAVTDTLATLTSTQTLTNKTLTSPNINSPVLTNSGNTLTLPATTDTLVGRATTDTLTNKTLTSPVISTISNTGTLTLPTSTDTLIGRATTDTLTNKTFDTAGTGNVFKIGGSTVSTVAQVQALLLTGTYIVTATGVNFNVANSDNSITIPLISGSTNYRVTNITLANASASISTATCGLFSASGAGGTAILAAGTAITVTASTANTNNNIQVITPTISSNTESFNFGTLFFRIGTAQGSAATADVMITIVPVY